MSRSQARRGFSLLELMVVIAIVGLVAGVVLAAFSGGIRVWESANALTRVEQEAYFGSENVRRDLANTFAFHDLGIAGEQSFVSFPGLVPAVDDDGNESFRVGTIKYLHDNYEKQLYRLAWPYPEQEDNAFREVLASGVEAVFFQYLKPGADVEDGWTGSWQTPTNFPAAVAVEMSFGYGGQALVVRREIPLMEALWRED